MDAYNTINDILVHLFNEIWELEKKAIITEEFKDITTMSVVAKKMKITAGSLTTAVNGLVNKKYVMRARGEEDRRVVYIWLTEKGEKAYYHHEEFHREMTNAVLNRLDEKEIPVLMKTLDGLSEFFRGYSSEE